jgi:hypothetical protein
MITEIGFPKFHCNILDIGLGLLELSARTCILRTLFSKVHVSSILSFWLWTHSIEEKSFVTIAAVFSCGCCRAAEFQTSGSLSAHLRSLSSPEHSPELRSGSLIQLPVAWLELPIEFPLSFSCLSQCMLSPQEPQFFG